jgi:hypothetical protein
MATDAAVKIAESLSHAEITQACDNANKETILADRQTVTATLLKQMLQERRSAYSISSDYDQINRRQHHENKQAQAS